MYNDKINIEEVRSDMGAIKYFYDKYIENEIQLGTLTTCINTFYHKYDNIIEIKSGETTNKKELSKDIHNVKKTISQMDSMCKNGCTYESLKPLFNYINFLMSEITKVIPDDYVNTIEKEEYKWDNADGYVEYG